MPIPDFQSLKFPLLKFAAEGEEYALREVIDFCAIRNILTGQVCSELLASRQRPLREIAELNGIHRLTIDRAIVKIWGKS